MLNRWRTAIVLFLAASAAVVGQLAAVAPADAVTGPTISIAVRSTSHPVTGDVYVVFDGGVNAYGHFHGTITGAKAGEVAALYGQVWPYKKPPVRIQSAVLKASNTTYSFTARPRQATRYAVRLFLNGNRGAPALATSKAVNLYVIPALIFKGGSGACTTGVPVCHKTGHVLFIVPSFTEQLEMGKHLYPYFGLALSSKKVPPPPDTLTLDGGHAQVSKVRKNSAIEFEFTVSFSFNVGTLFYEYHWTTCTKATEAQDGVGLPGSHDCGAPKIQRINYYLGEPSLGG